MPLRGESRIGRIQRGGGRSTVPVGSALLGSILAVTALCATAAGDLVIGTGEGDLDHFRVSPRVTSAAAAGQPQPAQGMTFRRARRGGV